MQFSIDQLSVTSYDTYTKDEPQVLTHNTFNAKGNTDTELIMYPMMNNTDDEDDNDDEYESCTHISDYSHPMPGTCVPPSYHQCHGTINCCHPAKYPRKQ